jgi:glycine oxidase
LPEWAAQRKSRRMTVGDLTGVRVLVVGAGMFGLWTAYACLARGARVTVLDRAAPAGRQSAARAAAGMLAPTSETVLADHPVDERFSVFLAAGRDAWRSATLQLKDDSHVEHGYAEGPTLIYEDTGAAPVEAAHDGWVDPRAVHAALVSVVQHHGVLIEGVEVETVASHTVTLRDGCTLTADVIALAPGIPGKTMAAAEPALEAVTPVKGQILRLRRPAGMPMHCLRSRGVYVVPRGTRDLVIGATWEPGVSDTAIDETAIAALQTRAAALAPDLAGAARLDAWAGVRPSTPDHLPLLGAGRTDGVLIAAGGGRNGVLLGPWAGAAIADLAAGLARPDIASLAPERFLENPRNGSAAA